jgi:transcriptional regulator with XRE-family HTH domain
LSTESSAALRRRVGRRIAERRAALGWTQEQLAEKIGISTRYLQAIESGAENLTLDSLGKFARALRGVVADPFAWAALPKARGRGRPRRPVGRS